MILGLSKQFGGALPSQIRAEDVTVIRMLELAAMGKVDRDEAEGHGDRSS